MSSNVPNIPQWVTTWPDWYGPEFSGKNVTVVPKDDYEKLVAEVGRLEKEIESLYEDAAGESL